MLTDWHVASCVFFFLFCENEPLTLTKVHADWARSLWRLKHTNADEHVRTRTTNDTGSLLIINNYYLASICGTHTNIWTLLQVAFQSICRQTQFVYALHGVSLFFVPFAYFFAWAEAWRHHILFWFADDMNNAINHKIERQLFFCVRWGRHRQVQSRGTTHGAVINLRRYFSSSYCLHAAHEALF